MINVVNSKGQKKINQPPAAWDASADWYHGLVGDRGMELQHTVVFPAVLRLLQLGKGDRLLDVACGQGAFCREARRRTDHVVGVDASRQLVARARACTPHGIVWHIGDARQFSEEVKRDGPYDALSCILALGNIDDVASVLAECHHALSARGRIVLVISHPCFRIPRQSGWGWDEQRKLQYRRIDRYMSEIKIPITMHPGAARSEVTWTYHRPLAYYVRALFASGFVIDALEELTTSRRSTPGPRARADTRSKEEIPLFLAIRARIISGGN